MEAKGDSEPADDKVLITADELRVNKQSLLLGPQDFSVADGELLVFADDP